MIVPYASLISYFALLSHCVAAVQLEQRQVSVAASEQLASAQQTELCLQRVAPLSKAEGYGALCTSIGALYQQEVSAAESVQALQQEKEQLRVSKLVLEKEKEQMLASQLALEQENRALKAHIEELKQQHIKREEEWKAAAKKFQAQVASRDVKWQATMTDVRSAEARNYASGLARRDAQWREVLSRGKAQEDAHWQVIVEQHESQKKDVEKRVESEENELAVQIDNLHKQKEAMEASTFVAKKDKRKMLLALSREKQKTHAETKEVQAWIKQVKVLQAENAQLVKRCIAGTS